MGTTPKGADPGISLGLGRGMATRVAQHKGERETGRKRQRQYEQKRGSGEKGSRKVKVGENVQKRRHRGEAAKGREGHRDEVQRGERCSASGKGSRAKTVKTRNCGFDTQMP